MVRDTLCILAGHLSRAICDCEHTNRCHYCKFDKCDLLSKVRTLELRVSTKLTYFGNYSLVSNTICQSHCSSAVLQNTTMTFPSSVMNLYAPTIKVAWHTSDMLRWREGPATSTPTALSLQPTSSAKSGDLRPSSNTGVIAAIAVGSIAAVAMFAVIALLFWRRRSKWSKLPKDDDAGAHKVELSGEGKKHAELPDEAGLHESEAQERPKEVAEQHASAELDSGWTGWEAPTLLELDFSDFGREDANAEERTTRQECRSSIQETPVDMIVRRWGPLPFRWSPQSHGTRHVSMRKSERLWPLQATIDIETNGI